MSEGEGILYFVVHEVKDFLITLRALEAKYVLSLTHTDTQTHRHTRHTHTPGIPTKDWGHPDLWYH